MLSAYANPVNEMTFPSSLYVGLEDIGQGNNNLVSRGKAIDFTKVINTFSTKVMYYMGNLGYF